MQVDGVGLAILLGDKERRPVDIGGVFPPVESGVGRRRPVVELPLAILLVGAAQPVIERRRLQVLGPDAEEVEEKDDKQEDVKEEEVPEEVQEEVSSGSETEDVSDDELGEDTGPEMVEYDHDGFSLLWNKKTNELIDPDDSEVMGTMVADDEGNWKPQMKEEESDEEDSDSDDEE